MSDSIEQGNAPQAKFMLTPIASAMSSAYLDYAKFVIQGRALPDVRDGNKPVHRRVLYAQQQLGNISSKPYKKSARVVGDVIGKYHPHGDTAVYDTIVRLAQSFAMSVPLIDGQGNFGGRDGDNAAAMRYTEVRMSQIGEAIMEDINHGCVDYEDNYDASERMPSVLPVRFPNLIVNGSQGIAVGMACNIPSHNPVEAMNCVIHMLRSELSGERSTIDELMEIMPAPDFPTGGLIHGLENFREVWESGRGKFYVRSKWHEEDLRSKRCLVLTEIPYAINKAKLIADISQKSKPNSDDVVLIEGIQRVLDSTTKDDFNGVRIVIELKNGYEPEIVFNELCKHTKVEAPFSYNMNVIKDKKPQLVGLYEAFEAFIEFRKDTVLKRTKFFHERELKAVHLLSGLMKAIDNLDETIATIRRSANTAESRLGLMNLLGVDEDQANYILAMKLQSLANSGLEDARERYDASMARIAVLEGLLANEDKRIELIIEESEREIDRFYSFKDPRHEKVLACHRRCEFQIPTINIKRKDLVPNDSCAVILTEAGNLKRVKVEDVQKQNRGTQGRSQIKFNKGDSTKELITVMAHDKVAIVTDRGRITFLDAYDIEMTDKGTHLNNFVSLEQDERVKCLFNVTDEDQMDAESKVLIIGTEQGQVVKMSLAKFATSLKYGRTINAVSAKHDGDLVSFAFVASDEAFILVSTSGNKTIRFNVSQIRQTSRGASGVKAVKLVDGAKVNSGVAFEPEDAGAVFVTVTKKGMVRLTDPSQYPDRKRGGQGVKTISLNEGDETLTTFKMMMDASALVMTTTSKGLVNKFDLSGRTVHGRYAKGVILTSVKGSKDYLVSAVPITNCGDEVDDFDDLEDVPAEVSEE